MNLTQLRESRRLSREAVARTLGMKYHGIRRLEEEGTTHLSTLEAYAEALGVPFEVVYQASRATRGLTPDPSATCNSESLFY